MKNIKGIVIPKKDLSHFKSSKTLGQIILRCIKLKTKELRLLKFYIEDYLNEKTR